MTRQFASWEVARAFDVPVHLLDPAAPQPVPHEPQSPYPPGTGLDAHYRLRLAVVEVGVAMLEAWPVLRRVRDRLRGASSGGPQDAPRRDLL